MVSNIKREAILDFWQKRGDITDASAARFHSDHTPYDLTAISAVTKPGDRVLDLGCGTCAMANEIVESGDVYVHAVDVVPAFLNFARTSPNLTVEIADLLQYKTDTRYDVIMLMGVINSFPLAEERESLYDNCSKMLKATGTFFIKSQFGRSEDVIVNKYSEDLRADYMAIYPFIEHELSLLEKYFAIDRVVDPYPAELNPHHTTHFHYIYARAK